LSRPVGAFFTLFACTLHLLAALILHGFDVHLLSIAPEFPGVLKFLFIASSFVHFDVPPSSVFHELRLVFLPNRYGTVSKNQGSSTFVLAIVEPHVDIAVERTRGSDLQFRRPADPVNGVLMRTPLVQHFHIVVLENDVFSLLLLSSFRYEGSLGFGSSLTTHLLLLSLVGFLLFFLGGVKQLFLRKLVE